MAKANKKPTPKTQEPPVADETSNASIKIAGESFNIPQPYTEGHTLAANEASALNQLFAENLRNNFAGKVKKVKEAGGDVAALQTELDTYAASYKFGIRAVSAARTVDPVEREARRLAKEAIIANLKAKGKKVKDYTAEQIDGAVDALLAKEPKYHAAAQDIIAQKQSVAGAAMEDLLPA